MAGAFSIETGHFNRSLSSRPRARATMANSDFWRDLAISFHSVAILYEFTAHRFYYMELSIVEPTWNLSAAPTARAEFGALARRGASMLCPSPTGDLFLAWLEALWREATHGPVRTPSEIVGKDRTGKLTQLHGKIDRVFQASSALCRKFESEALQSEFEERRRNDPKNWSEFRRQVEALETIKEIRDAPAKQIPEEFVRNTIARIRGIKPEDVTKEQIAFEVAGLLPFYSHIELIPATPRQESTPESDAKPTEQPEPKPAQGDPPAETIAAQLQRLRVECELTEEELAEEINVDIRSVQRHLANESIPRALTIRRYEKAFSKLLKQQIVIRQMP